MQILKEVTQWDTNTECNHTYLLDGDKIVAYRPHHTGDVQYIKSQPRIDRRGRKFVEVKDNAFVIADVKSKLISITGSKGNTYQIDPDAGTCTCPGFTFRNTCKHIKEYV